MGQNQNAEEFEESLKAEVLLKFEWCRTTDSNHRPTDYKSAALPTELVRHRSQQATRISEQSPDFLRRFQ